MEMYIVNLIGSTDENWKHAYLTNPKFYSYLKDSTSTQQKWNIK